jgi:hypothetical protein
MRCDFELKQSIFLLSEAGATETVPDYVSCHPASIVACVIRLALCRPFEAGLELAVFGEVEVAVASTEAVSNCTVSSL